MKLKNALAIGAVAACTSMFNTACVVVPANGTVTSYGTPTYSGQSYYGQSYYGQSYYGQSYAPSYVGPRIQPYFPPVFIGPRLGPSYNWGSNHGWAPRHSAPPAHHHHGGHGGYRR